MLKNIFISTLRNILRNRTFSLINLIGLSVSMSLGMLILMIVKEQFTFDNFHRDAERIYRVNTRALKVEGYTEEWASAPLPLGNAIQDHYTFTEHVVRVNRFFGGDVSHGNVKVPAQGLLVDPAFFEVFHFPFAKGTAATALAHPNGLVLTQRAAIKIFGKAEPLGQPVSIGGFGDFIVTGVLQESASKTHFDFEMLGSTTALPAFEREKKVMEASLDNWHNYYINYIYVKLKDGQMPDHAEKALAEISKKHYDDASLPPGDKGFEFYLQPLSAITPGPELANQMGSGMPMFFLVFLSVLAGTILLMSVFNFTNLMIAKSLSRAREIGVRKVVGAQRLQVFMQFVGETVLFSLLALAFSYVLLQFLKSGYLQLPLNEDFAISLDEDFSLLVIFVVFAVVVGILAGLIPAAYLSAFRPVNVLKDAGSLKIYSRLAFRKALMVAQFTLSIIIVIVVLVIYRQIDFMLQADYGFDQKDKLNIHLQGVSFQKMATGVRNISGAVSVGGVSHPLGVYRSQRGNYKRSGGTETFEMSHYHVDDNYVSNLGLHFVAGRNFDAAEQRGLERHIVLNETALAQFGFQSPAAAVGQAIFADDSVMLEVIGVVRDFHFRPLESRIEPLGLRYDLNRLSYLSVKIDRNQKDAVVEAIASFWKTLEPDHALEYAMMEDEIDDAYRQAGMHDVLVIVGYIAFLAVTLACLGMLGMAMYATQIRIKEVGVRKVMGASTSQVVLLLSKSFVLLIGVGVLIGTPISFLVGSLFLDSFAYRIQISPLLVGTGIALVTALGLLIVCTQTIRTASSNPVKSLRYE